MPPKDNKFEPLSLQYRFILDHTPGMLWTATPDGQVDYVNEWMVQFTGRQADELLGEGWRDIVHPEDRSRVAREWQRVLRSQTPSALELRFRRSDGAYRWYLRNVIPYRDASGKLVKWVGVNTDIHEQKLKEVALRENETLRQTRQRLEAEKEFSARLLENSTDGILALDAQGNVTAWNQTLETLSGKRRAEVLGKPVSEVFPAEGAMVAGDATPAGRFPQPQSPPAEAAGRALLGETITLPAGENPFDVREGWYEIIFTPLPGEEDRVAGVLGIVRDVTARKKQEAERLQAELLGQRETLRAVLHTQEEERQRIAESLHNGLGQLLFATRLSLQRYFVDAKKAGTQEAESLQKVDALLKEAIIQSKLISADLVPSIIREYGLEAALTDWTGKLSTPALRIGLRVVGLTQRLEPAYELNVFRIVQALLGSVLVQAQAGEVQVVVAQGDGGLSIVVQSKGAVFGETGLAHPDDSPGMRGVRSRVALLGGKVNLEPVPGEGTLVHVFLPLPG